MRWSTIAVMLLGLAAVLPGPAASQTPSCLETGPRGVYPGWHGLSHGERASRCLAAEQRELERQERIRERETTREMRREPGPEKRGEASKADSERERQRRQQECLANAAACDTPGSR